MAITAENLGKQYKITRQECDAFALLSQQRWAAAQKAGRFNAEMVAVEVKGKKGPEFVNVDEHPRPQATLESLAKLKPVFVKDNGLVTAG
jgi:acetyl-CoA acyltransferase 2